MIEYSQEQLRELYQNLPKELQDALYSQENAKKINEICKKNNITDEKAVFDVAKITGYVLFGLLSPDNLETLFENDLKIEKNASEIVASEITKHVFMPIKNILEPLYKTELKFNAGMETSLPNKDNSPSPSSNMIQPQSQPIKKPVLQKEEAQNKTPNQNPKEAGAPAQTETPKEKPAEKVIEPQVEKKPDPYKEPLEE